MSSVALPQHIVNPLSNAIVPPSKVALHTLPTVVLAKITSLIANPATMTSLSKETCSVVSEAYLYTYQTLLADLQADPISIRYMPAALLGYKETIQAIYNNVMTRARAIGLTSAEIKMSQQAPLHLIPVMQLIEIHVEKKKDQDLLRFFKCLKKSLGGEAEIFYNGLLATTTLTAKAAIIRDWIRAHEAELQNVITLNLSNMQLRYLPSEIGYLRGLRDLNLSYNQLTSLPDSIQNLRQIITLSLSSNKLISLPEWIGNFRELRTLSLNNNQLASLPQSIENLNELLTLFLDNNRLTSLPESIGNLTRLKQLYINSNHLVSLPDSIGNLRQLEGLFATFNQLTTLPESIEGLRTLQGLFLSSNKIAFLPTTIGNLLQLELFDLRFNQLVSLPDTTNNLKKLKCSVESLLKEQVF